MSHFLHGAIFLEIKNVHAPNIIKGCKNHSFSSVSSNRLKYPFRLMKVQFVLALATENVVEHYFRSNGQEQNNGSSYRRFRKISTTV